MLENLNIKGKLLTLIDIFHNWCNLINSWLQIRMAAETA